MLSSLLQSVILVYGWLARLPRNQAPPTMWDMRLYVTSLPVGLPLIQPNYN